MVNRNPTLRTVTYQRRHTSRRRRCVGCGLIDVSGSGMRFNAGWHCWSCAVRKLQQR